MAVACMQVSRRLALVYKQALSAFFMIGTSDRDVPGYLTWDTLFSLILA